MNILGCLKACSLCEGLSVFSRKNASLLFRIVLLAIDVLVGVEVCHDAEDDHVSGQETGAHKHKVILKAIVFQYTNV